jgi:hypothetical protein
MNLKLVNKFHVIFISFWSDGGGPYIFQLEPDFVVNVDGACNFVPSPIHAGSATGGFEYTIKNSLLHAYYVPHILAVTSRSRPASVARPHTPLHGSPGSGSSQNLTTQKPHADVLEESELRRLETHHSGFLSVMEPVISHRHPAMRQASIWEWPTSTCVRGTVRGQIVMDPKREESTQRIENSIIAPVDGCDARTRVGTVNQEVAIGGTLKRRLEIGKTAYLANFHREGAPFAESELAQLRDIDGSIVRRVTRSFVWLELQDAEKSRVPRRYVCSSRMIGHPFLPCPSCGYEER